MDLKRRIGDWRKNLRHELRRIKLTRISGAVIVVAFGLIPILQAAVSAFSPRPVVFGLLWTLVFMVAVSYALWQGQRALNSELEGLLKIWPLRQVRDAHDLQLGVFPPPPGARWSFRTTIPRLMRSIPNGSWWSWARPAVANRCWPAGRRGRSWPTGL